MRHILLTLLLGFFLSIESRADWPSEDMDEQIDATNVIIGDHGDGFCSGTIISDTHRLILTADHCVAHIFKTRTERKVDEGTGEVEEVEIEEQNGFLDIWQNKYLDYNVVGQNHFAAKVLKRDYRADVAVLQVIDPEWKPPMVAPFVDREWKMRRGQTIYVVGNPAGILDASVSKGIVSNTQRKLIVGDYPTNYFQTDAAVIGGNSGGAAYTEDGHLVGVISAAMRTSTIAFVVPIQEVRNLLLLAGFPEFGGKKDGPTGVITGPPMSPYGGPIRLRLAKDIRGWFFEEVIDHMDR